MKIIVWFGMALGNTILCQLLDKPFSRAVEISYFQLFPFICLYVLELQQKVKNTC